MLKAALFDLDGTLVDDIPAHMDAWEFAFQKAGYQIPRERIHAQVGKTGMAIVEALIDHPGLEVIQLILDMQTRHFQAGIDNLLPFSQAHALLETLHRQGILVALVTSARKENADRVSSRVQFCFDARVTAADITRGKPDPEPFLCGLKKLAVAPFEAVAVGDSPYDAQSAVAAGIRFVGVLTGGFSREALMSAGAWRVYPDLAGILADLDSLIRN